MRSAAVRILGISAIFLSAVMPGGAQQAPASKSDPRIGLKAGLHDAGEAAFNMERIAGLPKPDGFFDPKAPAGNPAPPERPADPTSRQAPAGRRP